MQALKIPRYTEAEYLEFDATHEGRHEYMNGEILAMAGASFAHLRLASNAMIGLGRALTGRPGVPYAADLRVAIDETGLYAYPDITVVCGAPELAPTAPETLLNPTVLIEVLSEITASYDRGEKLEHYRRRASVQAVVLIDSRERRVTVVSRNADATWTITDAVQGAVTVPGIDVVLELDELYAGVGCGADG